VSRPNDIVSKGRCEELRKLVRLQVKTTGTTASALAKASGVPSGSFHQFMNGRALRALNERKLARALGIAPAEAIAAPPAAETVMAKAIASTARELEKGVRQKTMRLSDADMQKVRAIIREAQGAESLSKFTLSAGLGITALHGFMRGSAGMSPAMANRIMEKLGRPERFQGTVPRALPQKSRKRPLRRGSIPAAVLPSDRLPAAEVARIRAQLEAYIRDQHHGSAHAAAPALGVPKSGLYRILHGGGTLRQTAAQIAKVLGPPDAAAPPKSRQLALPLNGEARTARALPAKISVDAFLEGPRLAAPVETTVAAMMARWRREAFALVCRLAQEGELL
jgi:predicted transcriptional regulator